MNLDFKILWFDDQPDNVSGQLEGINSRVKRLGFNCKVTMIQKVGDLDSTLGKYLKGTKPDLILMDWNLGNDVDDGAKVSKEVRNKFHHTDIIFYSADSPQTLRKAIFDQDIDGVYCAIRDDLVGETMGVINTMLQKILDMNHMRGIVMGSVSEFDLKMLDCIQGWYDNVNAEHKGVLVGKIYTDAVTYFKKELAKIEKEDPKSYFTHLTENPSSYSLCSILNRITNKCCDGKTTKDLTDKQQKYNEEVLIHRNALAHARQEVVGGKQILKRGDKEYNEESFKQVRKNLIEHTRNLDDIHQAIDKGKFLPAE